MSYEELSIEERATIQVSRLHGMGQNAIARLLGRSPSTISRELRRNTGANGIYHAPTAQGHMRQRREACRQQKKLVPDSELFELVVELLRKNFSPEQIAGKLRSMDIPSFEDAYVCRETIYSAVYALPVGELRKELIRCLRQGKNTRRPRVGGVDRRNQIPEMVSIHVRPPEVEDRLMPGHWEGDLIKGKANASAVGTLNERTSGYLMLIKLNDATATSAVEGFSAAQHPREDDAADFNIHVGRLGLVAVHAGLQIAAADNFRAAHDGFLTVWRIVRAGDIVTP